MGRTQAHHWDGEADSVAALVQAMRTDASYEVRATAAQTLGVFQSEPSIEPLIQTLDKDGSSAVRAAATESLGTMTDKPKAVDRLVDVLDFERDDTVLVNAMKALKFTQDPRVLEPVIKALRSGNAKLRWQALDTLEGQRASSSIPHIKRIAEDPRETDGIRAKANEALELIGTE